MALGDLGDVGSAISCDCSWADFSACSLFISSAITSALSATSKKDMVRRDWVSSMMAQRYHKDIRSRVQYISRGLLWSNRGMIKSEPFQNHLKQGNQEKVSVPHPMQIKPMRGSRTWDPLLLRTKAAGHQLLLLLILLLYLQPHHPRPSHRSCDHPGSLRRRHQQRHQRLHQFLRQHQIRQMTSHSRKWERRGLLF